MSITKSPSRNKPCSFKENQWKNRKKHAFLMIDLIQRYNGNSSREKEDVGEDTQRKMTRTSMFKTRYQQSLKLAASEFSNETTVWYNFECLEIRINVVLFWWNTKGTYYLQKHSTEPRSCMPFLFAWILLKCKWHYPILIESFIL